MTGPGRHRGWLSSLVSMSPSWSVRPDRIVLAAVGVTAPVGVALVLSQGDAAIVGAGALASMGALVGSIMDRGEAGIERVRRMALSAAAATVGFAIGTAVFGHPLLTLVAVVVAAFISGVAGAVDATTSRAALYFLVYVVTAANAEFGLAQPWAAPLVFLGGALWRLLLTVVDAALLGRTLVPERRAVAAVYRAIADQLAAVDTTRLAASEALTRALNDAYDVLAAARTTYVVRARRWQALVSLLNASGPVVDAAIAQAALATGVHDDAAVRFLRETAAWIEDPSAPRPGPCAPSAARGRALQDALDYIHRVCAERDLAHGGRAAPDEIQDVGVPPLRERVRRSLQSFEAGRETWLTVLRLVLCMGVAQALSIALQLDRPYLVMLAVAQVMKPDLGSVFARAVQRGGGTVLGVVVGSAMIAFVPRDAWQLLVIAVLAALVPPLMARNFALYSGASAALAVVLVEIHVGQAQAVPTARILDTLLGCAVALVVGYALWPSTWRAPVRLSARMATAVFAISAYVAVALPPRDLHERVDARRAANREISDLRGALTRALSDPALGRAADAWMPGVTALERVVDAVTAASTLAAQEGADLDPGDVSRVRAALDGLAAALSDDVAPPASALPEEGPLADLGDEIATARTTLGASGRRARARGRLRLRS